LGDFGFVRPGFRSAMPIVLRRLVLAFLVSWIAASGAHAETLLENAYRQMYDLRFDEAHKALAEWTREHPEDPLGPVSDAAAYLYAEFDRLHILQSEFFLEDSNFLAREKLVPDAQVKQHFEEALARSQQLSGPILAKTPLDRNALFAEVLRLGLQADYLALVEKKYLASLSDVKVGRGLAEKLLAVDPNYGDAYLAVGTENYLLSLRAAPVRWLLRMGGAETDKDRGVHDLMITVEKGHYLPPYAKVLLAVAAGRDKNFARARELLESLVREFPHNPLYSQELARLH